MTHYIVLLYLCQAAGLVMICGGIVLLYQQKIRLDEITKEINVDVPFFGKLRTNAPAIALFIIGFIPLMYPLQHAKTEYIHVRQAIESDNHPVLVYAVVGSRALQSDGELHLSIPVVANEDYSPQLIYVAGEITDEQELLLESQKGGVITLQRKIIQHKKGGSIPAIQPDVTKMPENFR